MVCIEIRNAIWKVAGQRIAFQEEFAAETQDGRRSMVRQGSSTYNRSCLAELSERIKEQGGTERRARETETRRRAYKSEREREITKASPLSGNCAMACQRGA